MAWLRARGSLITRRSCAAGSSRCDKCLYRIDAEVAHALELDLGFHAFGDKFDPEVAGGLGDALDDGRRTGRLIDVLENFRSILIFENGKSFR